MTVAVPPDRSLVGRSFYGQGLLLDPTVGAIAKLALTRAFEARVGL